MRKVNYIIGMSPRVTIQLVFILGLVSVVSIGMIFWFYPLFIVVMPILILFIIISAKRTFRLVKFHSYYFEIFGDLDTIFRQNRQMNHTIKYDEIDSIELGILDEDKTSKLSKVNNNAFGYVNRTGSEPNPKLSCIYINLHSGKKVALITETYTKRQVRKIVQIISEKSSIDSTQIVVNVDNQFENIRRETNVGYSFKEYVYIITLIIVSVFLLAMIAPNLFSFELSSTEAMYLVYTAITSTTVAFALWVHSLLTKS